MPGGAGGTGLVSAPVPWGAAPLLPKPGCGRRDVAVARVRAGASRPVAPRGGHLPANAPLPTAEVSRGAVPRRHPRSSHLARRAYRRRNAVRAVTPGRLVRVVGCARLGLGDAVRVFDREGERVDRGRAELRDGGLTVVAPLDVSTTGSYTVAWKVVSEDSHVLLGSFVFHVDEVTGAASVDLGGDRPALDLLARLARWAVFTGMALTAGSRHTGSSAAGTSICAPTERGGSSSLPRSCSWPVRPPDCSPRWRQPRDAP
ncbi:MAG: hypothetical protein GEV08_13380 [Acidimicrobiia bacterium]|nr:hypothetical protein [Acidimicrobiia bacterium]